MLVNKVFSRYYVCMKSNNIYDYVERLSELLTRDSRRAGIEHGLQPVQLQLLHYLAICNRFSNTPMAVTEYLGLTKGTVSQTLKVLEKKGLLSKQLDESDKRITHLNLTEVASELLQHTIPTTLFINACETLPKKKKLAIEESLKCLLTALLQANDLKTFGVCRSCRFNLKVKNGDYFCKLVEQPLSVSDTQLICKEHDSKV